ncbi:hypothetical protein [Levilactobacillus fuyuanensis]
MKPRLNPRVSKVVPWRKNGKFSRPNAIVTAGSIPSCLQLAVLL